jgi:hypothetical protein
MTVVDDTAQSQSESISFEFDLHHGARYGWTLMGGKLVDLPARIA